MKITFIGQKGLAPLSAPGLYQREKRVQALAVSTAKAGHSVTLSSASPFTTRNVKNLGAIKIRHYPSLDPRYPGGLLPVFLNMLGLWRTKPDIVHIHGLKAASLAWLARFMSPSSALVLTIDNLASPARRSLGIGWVLWLASKICDRLTVPTRQLQYILLAVYNIRSTYIPDGYSVSPLKDIPAKNFGLRKGHYIAAYLDNKSDLKWVIKARQKLKTAKKLAVLCPAESLAELKALAKRNQVELIEFTSPRQLASLLESAAAITLPSQNTPVEVILSAMAAKKPIAGSTYHLHEETLGTAAQIVRSGDVPGLTGALQSFLQNKTISAPLSLAAHTRAQAHFRLSRILAEYLRLYNRLEAQKSRNIQISRVPSLDGIILSHRPLFNRRSLPLNPLY